MGYVDKTGRAVITPQFQHARSFSKGRARFAVWSKVSCQSGGQVTHYTSENAPDSILGDLEIGESGCTFPIVDTGLSTELPRNSGPTKTLSESDSRSSARLKFAKSSES